MKRFIFISDQRPTLSPRVDGGTICISQQEDVIPVPSSRQTKLSNWGKGERLVLIPYTFRGRRGFTREIIFREMLHRYIGIIYRRNNTILNDDFPHGLDKCESGRAP